MPEAGRPARAGRGTKGRAWRELWWVWVGSGFGGRFGCVVDEVQPARADDRNRVAGGGFRSAIAAWLGEDARDSARPPTNAHILSPVNRCETVDRPVHALAVLLFSIAVPRDSLLAPRLLPFAMIRP